MHFLSFFLDELMTSLQPKWIPPQITTDQYGNSLDLVDPYFTDGDTGIVLGRLNNGIRINFKKTNFESNRCSIKVFFVGGRVVEEKIKCRPQQLNLGVKSLLDGGVGGYSQYLVARLITLWGLDIRGCVDNEVGPLRNICSF